MIKEKTIIPHKQDETLVTVAKKLQKDEEKIDFTKSAKDIHNLVRGIYKSPSAYMVFKDKKIKILKTRVMDNSAEHSEYGKVLNISKDGIELSAKKGSILVITIKPEGKGDMAASAWVNGAKIGIGDMFL